MRGYKKILVGVIALVVLAIALLQLSIRFRGTSPQFGGEEPKIILHETRTNFTNYFVDIKPIKEESYWIKFKNQTVYLTKFLVKLEDVNEFLNKFLKVGADIILKENTYSINNYNGKELITKRGYNIIIRKGDVILASGNHESETVKDVIKWFITKFG